MVSETQVQRTSREIRRDLEGEVWGVKNVPVCATNYALNIGLERGVIGENCSTLLAGLQTA